MSSSIKQRRKKNRLKKKVVAFVIYLLLILVGVTPFGIDIVYAAIMDVNVDKVYELAGPEVVGIAYEVGEERQIAAELILAIAYYESGFNADAVSESGAIGHTQVKPEFSKYTAEELKDTRNNFMACCDILDDLASEYDDLYLVLTGYRYGEYSHKFKKALDGGSWCLYAKKIVDLSDAMQRKWDTDIYEDEEW